MVLIADSGSSKTDWRVMKEGAGYGKFKTPGLNPFYMNQQEIGLELKKGMPPDFPSDEIQEIYFYGAGCSTQEKKQILYEGIKMVFPNTGMEIFSDIIGAARALFKNTAGLVVILGTGTNTASYDGENIIRQIPALGYILGDEGSGAYFGKELIVAYLNNKLPQSLYKKFINRYEYSVEEIKHSVYKQQRPNRFLASFAGFLSDNMEDPFVHGLIYNGFKKLFENQICRIDGWDKLRIRFTGSVAFYFQSILSEVASEFGTSIDKILKSPIEELLSFHAEQFRQG
ncbi:MAG: ATPase [Bacteroidales bacterium]|nr:MAG: ATPase [Bacteroidales bacterium]